jgi:hypothetical protein
VKKGSLPPGGAGPGNPRLKGAHTVGYLYPGGYIEIESQFVVEVVESGVVVVVVESSDLSV